MLSEYRKKWYTNGADGYATLLSMIVIGAIGLSVTVALLLFGVGFSRTGFAYQQSGQAHALADACVERALQEIRNITPFTGTDTLSIGTGTCTYAVTNQGGQNRIIDAEGLVGSVTRKVRVVIDAINPSIQIVSWQTVAQF